MPKFEQAPREVYEALVAEELVHVDGLPEHVRGHVARVLRDSVRFYYPAMVRRYDLPSEKGGGWAVITISEDGLFQAVSDYGSYGYWWTHHGRRDFREFLCRRCTCEDGTPDYYLVSKLAPGGEEYDGEATLKRVKQFIIEQRRLAAKSGRIGGWTRQYARAEWNRLSDDHGDLDTEFCFWDWTRETGMEADVTEFYTTAPSAQVTAFVSRTMPRLAKILRAELEAEGYWEESK